MSESGWPASTPWSTGAGPVMPEVRHAYPVLVRDHGLGSATALLLRSVPYALARFGVLLAASILALVWLTVAIGGAAWLGTHVAQAFGWVWLIVCLGSVGWLWVAGLRYFLFLVACGHVAVLTELITRGQVGDGRQSQFEYGRGVVTARFGEATALYGLNALVLGAVQAFHRTLDWIGELLPVPGIDGLASLATAILRASTRYVADVIFSYDLARNGADPWTGAREGIVYYCQNAKPILQTSVWTLILERALSFVLWLVLLAVAAGLTVMLPPALREHGGLVAVAVSVLLALTLRAAFIRPLFLIMIMVRFHALIENQPINAAWDARLAEISTQFQGLFRRGATAAA